MKKKAAIISGLFLYGFACYLKLIIVFPFTMPFLKKEQSINPLFNIHPPF